MTRPAWLSVVLSQTFGIGFVLVVMVAIFLFARGCHGTPDVPEEQKISPEAANIIRRLDSTAVTFQHEADSLRRVVVHDTVRAVVLRASEATSVASSARIEHLADSLARAAQTAEEWHRAHDVRKAEAETLKVALSKADSVAGAERDARLTISAAYGADTLRRIALERLTVDLRADIAKLDVPCRIIGPVPCASRTTTAGLGLLAGLLSGHYLK